jgi:6-phosphofructokinase
MAKRIGILTGGGDCPGLNAVIRAAVKAGLRRGWEIFGIRRGFEGLFNPEGAVTPLRGEAVSGILNRGATILGTSNRSNPFKMVERVATEITEGTGRETRTLVLGHLQRGGEPTTFYRLAARETGIAFGD